MPPPERIAERGRSKPRAGSDEMPAWRPVDAAGQERHDDRRRSEGSESDTDTRRNGQRGKIRHASTEAAGSACGTWLCMSRMIAVRVLVFMLATMRARHRTRRDRVIGACSVPACGMATTAPRTPSTQPRTTGSAGSAPAARRRGICASTTWMRNHAGNDRMGRRSAATARSGTRRPQLIAAVVTTTWPKHDRGFMTIPSSGGHPSRTHGALSSRVTLTGWNHG